MKLRMLVFGVFATAVVTSIAQAGEVALEYTVDVPDSPLGLSYTGSISGNLATVTISIAGLPAGHGTVGILNIANKPLLMYTSNGSPFYNSAGSGTSQPFAALDDPLDSGYFGPGYTGSNSDWGFPTNDMSIWAKTGGNNTTFNGPCFWITLDLGGVPAPDGPLDIMRVTWDISDSSNAAHGTFDFVLATPLNGSDEFYFQWTAFVPAPSALALLGLAGLAGTRRRRT